MPIWWWRLYQFANQWNEWAFKGYPAGSDTISHYNCTVQCETTIEYSDGTYKTCPHANCYLYIGIRIYFKLSYIANNDETLTLLLKQPVSQFVAIQVKWNLLLWSYINSYKKLIHLKPFKCYTNKRQFNFYKARVWLLFSNLYFVSLYGISIRLDLWLCDLWVL